ncbi:MAG TPA: D-aminoacyl-tRNA deacylase [Spirochaetales bacterium]|nr:D-aminoacyl-tRNA deacylase [Spirochaetales bacterium]HRY54924.1 D-aminoacyl-tRNA deacylase [Spirochaetia bacterium]HRZ65270.1 D-aminoacyl-tRNA deacylase [Spirochaetia bacterium]
MGGLKRAVYFFCADAIDKVAGNVLEAARELFQLEDAGTAVDGWPVLKASHRSGEEFHFVRTAKVVSHDYPHYLPILCDLFGDFDIAGVVTWHGGQNAPPRVLTTHTTGDVASGNFGPADPARMRALVLALEKNRIESGLDGFRTLTEATHWSGMVYDGGPPELLPRYGVPLLDIEIGSEPESWADPVAGRAIARSLAGIFEHDGARVRNLLCAGGVHFEPAFVGAVLDRAGPVAFAVSHILANQWLISGGYDASTGLRKLESCVASIRGGIDGIVFHDNLKGPYKDSLRELGRKLGIPAFKHQALRDPGAIKWVDRSPNASDGIIGPTLARS